MNKSINETVIRGINVIDVEENYQFRTNFFCQISVKYQNLVSKNVNFLLYENVISLRTKNEINDRKLKSSIKPKVRFLMKTSFEQNC